MKKTNINNNLECIITTKLNEKFNEKHLIVKLNFSTDSHYDEKLTLSDSIESQLLSINIKTKFINPEQKNTSDINILKVLVDMISAVELKYGIKARDILIIGTQVSAIMALQIDLHKNCNYLIVGPHFDHDSSIKNVKILRLLGFEINKSMLIEKINYRKYQGHGKVVFSHYDTYPFSYDDSLVQNLQIDERIQFITLEYYFYALVIKRSGNKIGNLVVKEINSCIEVFLKGLELQRYNFYPGDFTKKVTKFYENEKYFHKKIENKNRCLKYQLYIREESKVLVLSFSGEISSKYNHDVMSVYNFKSLANEAYNKLYIRPTFAISGGISMYDAGLTYTQELVSNLIENERKILSIKKDNVICIGSSAGGSAALFYAKLLEYKHVFARLNPKKFLNNLEEKNAKKL